MPDMEKVIKGLELCTNISQDGCLMLCPYKDEKDETYSGFCEQVLKQDALALLKEQETTQKDGYNLQELWKRARAGETLNETELNFLLADWDERNIFKQQEEGRLKEQEAKCLTKAELDDLNENQFVWIEERTGHLYYLQIIGICRGKTGVSDIQFNAPTSYVERSTIRYGKSYRIWTDKPTKEQSQAVKWE